MKIRDCIVIVIPIVIVTAIVIVSVSLPVSAFHLGLVKQIFPCGIDRYIDR